MIKIKIGGQLVIFMVDTGAEHSVVASFVAPVNKRTVTILGPPGHGQYHRPFARLISVNSGPAGPT